MIAKERCEVCGDTDKLTVDHGHDHGYIRGVLCSRCNTAEGMLRSNPEFALALAAYLRKPHTGILFTDYWKDKEAARHRRMYQDEAYREHKKAQNKRWYYARKTAM